MMVKLKQSMNRKLINERVFTNKVVLFAERNLSS